LLVALLLSGLAMGLTEPGSIPPQSPVTVQEIRIDGNAETKDYVIRKLLEVSVGQKLTQEQLSDLIAQSRQNLIESQYFNNAQVFDLPRTDPAKAVILVDVEESDPWHYGGSTSSVYIGRDNIGGTGTYLAGELGLDRQEADSTFNWLFATRLFEYDQIGHINQRRLIIESSSKESFVYEAMWGEAGLGWRFTPRIYFANGMRVELVKNSNFRITPQTAAQYGVYDDSRLVLNRSVFVYDLRDQQFDSHGGAYLSILGDSTVDPLGTGYSYSKGQAEMRNYFAIGRPMVVAFRFRGGVATPNTPYFKYFSISGIEGLRGAGYSSYLGTRTLLATLETRFHVLDFGLVNAWVELTPFVDYGRSWPPGNIPGFPLFWATGLALRIRIPYPYATTLRIEEGWNEHGFSTYWTLDNPF
jgi:outer membrane protein insertion porin family